MAGEGNLNMGMSESDIKAMKDALCSQQQLLQKLYAELDVEREASATAVSEALSMILRLQEEKSLVKMEATQYKRMTEEKISHAEESLANFEDLMYQKEMEIAALEFQVQAYKFKLLSMGVSEVGGNENRYPENFLMPKDDAFVGEMGSNEHVRRLKSLPPVQMKEFIQNRRRRSVTPDSDMVVKIVDEKGSDGDVSDQSFDSKKNPVKAETGDFDSYWEQIRKLDERVKVITDRSANLKAESRTSSLISQLSTGTFYDPTKCTNTVPTKLEEVNDPKTPLEKEALADSACSSSVYDVYEVPLVDENSMSCLEEEKRKKNKLIWEEENRLGKPDLFIEETWGSHGNDESELVKKLLRNQEKGLPPTREGTSIECNLALVHPQISISENQPKIQQRSRRTEPLEAEKNSTRHHIVAGEREEQMNLLNSSVADIQPEFELLRQRIERLESERNSSRHEIVAQGGEELTLLKEIHEQLNSIQSEMRSWRTKQSSRNNPSILSLQEVCLVLSFSCFSLQ